MACMAISIQRDDEHAGHEIFILIKLWLCGSVIKNNVLQ